MKNFKLTEKFIVTEFGVKLFQIIATNKFRYDVEVGDLGGWIEKENNLSGNAWVYGDAQVSGYDDYCCFQSFGSCGRTTTAFRIKSGVVNINCGCFSGSLKEFADRIKKTHGIDKCGKEYMAIIKVIKIKFNIK